LSAGRSELSDELQVLCFMAGASPIFCGKKLLTTGNPDTGHDHNLFERLKTVADPLKTVEFAAAAPALSTVTA
jgi:biotin synthase-like enzyme